MLLDELLEEIQTQKKFIIFGAQMVATSIYFALKEMYGIEPVLFCVSKQEKNPEKIDGIMVYTLDKMRTLDLNILILIATPEDYHSEIRKGLFDRGYHNIISVNAVLVNDIMKSYCKNIAFPVFPDILTGEGNASNDLRNIVSIYIAHSHFDRQLKNVGSKSDIYTKCFIPIQVGCTRTDTRIKNISIYDNTGDNISEKNNNYCELTATYWVARNCQSKYVGICHYRRLFELSYEKIRYMESEKVDAVLPYPSIQYPSCLEQHKRYITEADWYACKRAIDEVAPQYSKPYERAFRERIFYNYNMVICRKEIFQEYCNFLFPVLKRTEELTSPKGWERSDRFAGYLGENLTTLFFLANRERLKYIHTGIEYFV